MAVFKGVSLAVVFLAVMFEGFFCESVRGSLLLGVFRVGHFEGVFEVVFP